MLRFVMRAMVFVLRARGEGRGAKVGARLYKGVAGQLSTPTYGIGKISRNILGGYFSGTIVGTVAFTEPSIADGEECRRLTVR